MVLDGSNGAVSYPVDSSGEDGHFFGGLSKSREGHGLVSHEFVELCGGPGGELVVSESVGGLTVGVVVLFDQGVGLLEDVASEVEFSKGSVRMAVLNDVVHEFGIDVGSNCG